MSITTLLIDDIITTECETCHCMRCHDVLVFEFSSVIKASTMEEVCDISLVIYGWSSFAMSKFVPPAPQADGHWVTLGMFEPPVNIDVIRVAGNRLTLEGRSSKDGGWVKYDMLDFKYKIMSKSELN